MHKFESREEYSNWCENIVAKIYYADIAMSNTLVGDAVAEIAHTLHCSTGVELIKQDTENSNK